VRETVLVPELMRELVKDNVLQLAKGLATALVTGVQMELVKG